MDIDLSDLTARQREVIEMRYEAGLSLRDIAAMLSVSKRTVETHHSRALKRLRQTQSERSCRTLHP